MNKKTFIKKYLRGTGMIILCLVLILVSFYGLVTNGSDDARKIFFIIYSCISGVSLVAYWIYGYMYEKKHSSKDENK